MRVDSISRSRFRAAASLIFVIAMILNPVLVFADQQEIEVIDLLHRPAEEIMPLVSPFVTKGGSITGTDFKLIIKSTPENIEQIKKLLSKLDTALRQLVISISTDYAAIKSQQTAGVSGRVGNDRGNVTASTPRSGNKVIVMESGKKIQGGASVRDYSTRSSSQEPPAAQKIRVQEGQWAIIRTGKSIPVRQRVTNPDGTVTQTITYRNVTSGFKVRPQVSGKQVTLHVRPEQASLSESGGGQIDVSGLETTIQTRFGEWVELGGSLESLQSQESGITYSTQHREQQRQRIFVKVELQQ